MTASERLCVQCGVRREYLLLGDPQFIGGEWWQVRVCAVCSRTIIGPQDRDDDGH